MKLALTLLCIGGVTFLLRVLVALVLEAKRPARTWDPTPVKRRAELIVIPQDDLGGREQAGGQMAS